MSNNNNEKNHDKKTNPNQPATGDDRTFSKEVANEGGITDDYGVEKPMAKDEKNKKDSENKE